MELIPAIDILGGRIVRLNKGRYEEATVYGEDPATIAKWFEDAGVKRLHVVDLDGAREGTPRNVAAVERVLGATKLLVQVGGGIRDRSAADRWLSSGAARIVLGTAAVKDAAMVRGLCEAHPGRVIVAIDARNGEVAVEGWLESSGRTVEDLAREVDRWGVAAILYTNIERDGTRIGPDVSGTAALQKLVQADVIASGGIGSLEDIRALHAAGVRSAVCGRALYTGSIVLDEALRAIAGF